MAYLGKTGEQEKLKVLSEVNQSEQMLLENQLCFPLYACSKEVIRRYREPLEALGLTYTQYIVMLVLWQHGSMTEGEIGRIVHLESGTLAPLLKRMEKNGLVNRRRPKDNERKLMIELTAKGQELKKKAKMVPCAMENSIPLEKQELKQLHELLRKAVLRMHVPGA